MNPQDSIREVTASGLCIGCGACALVCPESVLDMEYQPAGLHQARVLQECSSRCGRCSRVCSFSGRSDSEDVHAERLFAHLPGARRDPVLGAFLSTWVVRRPDEQLRLRSASGGALTWMLESLLASGSVDRVACVASSEVDRLYSYTTVDSEAGLRRSAGSAYRALRVDEVLRTIDREGGRWAIVAVPCVVRSLRAVMAQNRKLATSIRYVFGLTCGQTKTDRFTEWLALVNGISAEGTVRFRTKDPDRTSDDFAVEFQGESVRLLHWRTEVAPAWHARLFTPPACGICDDVFAECADASFMDAWIRPYTQDWRGTSLVVARSRETESLLLDLQSRFSDCVEPIASADVVSSQSGAIKEKRVALRYRLWERERSGRFTPPKRVKPARIGTMRDRAVWRWEMSVSERTCSAMGADLSTPEVAAEIDAMVSRSVKLRDKARRSAVLRSRLRRLARAVGVGGPS